MGTIDMLEELLNEMSRARACVKAIGSTVSDMGVPPEMEKVFAEFFYNLALDVNVAVIALKEATRNNCLTPPKESSGN